MRGHPKLNPNPLDGSAVHTTAGDDQTATQIKNSSEMIHRHKCYRCQCVWQHDSKDFVWGTAQVVINLGHMCPQCGNRGVWCWYPYTGDEPPIYFNHHWPTDYKIPFYSRYNPFSNHGALYWHLVRDHRFESKLLVGMTHRELSGIHSHIHVDEAIRQNRSDHTSG